jgi:hypothetical protein
VNGTDGDAFGVDIRVIMRDDGDGGMWIGARDELVELDALKSRY